MFNYVNDYGMRAIRNDSGRDVEQFQILKLDGVVFKPGDNQTGFDNVQTFIGKTPEKDALFCIAQQPIANGAIGTALFNGVSICNVEFESEDETHANATDTADYLKASQGGPAEILYKEPGTGTRKAVVNLGPKQTSGFDAAHYLAKTTNDLSTETFSTSGTYFNLDIQNATNPTFQAGSSVWWSNIFGPRDDENLLFNRNPFLLLKQPGSYLLDVGVQVQFQSSSQDIELELRVVGENDINGEGGYSIIGRAKYHEISQSRPVINVTGFGNFISQYLPAEVRLFAKTSTGNAIFYDQTDLQTGQFFGTYPKFRNTIIYTPNTTFHDDRQHGLQTAGGPGDLL